MPSMPFDFDYAYEVTDLGGGLYEITSAAIAGPFTVIESEGNGIQVSENVTLNSNTYEYLGRTSNSEIVLLETVFNPDKYLFSDDNSLLINSTVQVFSYPICLVEGTDIETSRGIIKIEDAKIGDSLVCSDGSIVKIRWIGKQKINVRYSEKHSRPVKILKNALGVNKPQEDLWVSQNHLILVGDVLVRAVALVNSADIFIDKSDIGVIQYFGIDAGSTVVHRANGLEVGSLDSVPRESFDNYQEWCDLGLEIIDAPLNYPIIRSSYDLPQEIKVKSIA